MFTNACCKAPDIYKITSDKSLKTDHILSLFVSDFHMQFSIYDILCMLSSRPLWTVNIYTISETQHKQDSFVEWTFIDEKSISAVTG
jgi:hypothetical protein